MGTNLAPSMGDVGFDEDDEEWDVEVHGHVEVPCCSGLCYDKLAGGAAGVMLTSLLILIIWYMAMAMCATMVNEDANGPKVAAFPMIMLMVTVFWICLRMCFGPGEDQFRAIAIILVGTWLFYVTRCYMSGTDVFPMGCEFEVPEADPADDPNAAMDIAT